MTKLSFIGGLGAPALLAAPLFAAAMIVTAQPASALSCSVIAEQLMHQNTPLQDAKNRLTTCAKKYAKYPETLASKRESTWESLCDKNKSYYTTLLANRQQILVKCRPRGSDG